MKKHRLTLIIFLICSLAGFTACSQKLPVPSSGEEGVLVIAHHATDNTEAKGGFGYRYKLFYSPETPVALNINPGVTDFFIFKNFPAGYYEIDGITTTGNNGKRVIPEQTRASRNLHGMGFKIEPGGITLLDRVFVVRKELVSYDRWVQKYNFEYIKTDKKKALLKKISTFENAGLWKLPDPE